MWPWSPKQTKIKTASPVYESCWKIRTRLEPILSGGKGYVLTVTSAGHGEGKSMTAANLACTYAQQDKDVLLVDANFRNPTLHKLFGVSNRSGLSNLAEERYDVSEIVRCSKVPRLGLITSGPGGIDPIELLTSSKLSAFLNEIRNDYDMVLIDAPAALEWSDAHMLASLSDGVLLVVKEGRTKREHVLKLKAALQEVGAEIVGAVFHYAHRRKASVG
ncbi:CpsD/CapB family tyrosine-protein kinase [Cohnella caldifontis]|uniref:CpsD/CapB family tyrosine-protein kinase n=1 Tax=Cohnella caldifontis TaxID=3027471 RepID=UPI0023EA9B2B|nr:CpsD/CapB family tyrosine-protein kinase [Cohnella sp. YIM B05605]